jgi:hypothetical protein
MNAPTNPSRDHMLDKNLRRIAQNISLPTVPAAERVELWKNAAAQAWTEVPVPQQRSRLLKLWPLFTSAAAAAGIALAAFAILANPRPVSADTIFKSFRAVLGGPLTIRLDAIGFESVGVSGQIMSDADAAGRPRRYSEIHTILKSNNPQWADLDAVTVLNETPEQTWIFVRGAGGQTPEGLGPDGRYHVKVVEQYYAGQLPEFMRANALQLGSVPLGLAFSHDGSSVNYSFREPERQYLNSLLDLAQHIADAQDADDLIGRLQKAAGEVRVQPAERCWRLRAAAFQPNVLFPELDLKLADIDLPGVLDQVALQIEFVDPGVRYYTTAGEEPLHKLHLFVDQSALKAMAREAESADEFATRVRPLAREVTVSPGSHGGTAVRITGYDWKLDTCDRDRLRQLGTEIVPGIELLIEYDPQTSSIRWAEFRNLTPTGGTIRLQPGPAQLDPALLDPNHWITENTIVYD